jgi:hypothetical protein
VVNTHCDTDPYCHESLSKDNSITYCHFPLHNENIMHNLKEETKEKTLEREKVVEFMVLLEEYDAIGHCWKEIMSERVHKVDKVLMTLSLSPIIK